MAEWVALFNSATLFIKSKRIAYESKWNKEEECKSDKKSKEGKIRSCPTFSSTRNKLQDQKIKYEYKIK